jgi:tetratricopeptide (TPR) repeat protein
MRLWVFLVLVVYPFAAFGTPDEAAVLRTRGAALAQAGKCDEALPLFQRALAADPHEARAGLLAGRCQLAAKRYAEAEALLVDASRRDSSLAGVQLELAAARYHQENYAGARESLEKARPESAGQARFELYDGLVLLREGKRDEGVAALERARQADPKAVEPLASYAQGVVLSNQGETERARESLERARQSDPNGRWGNAAQTWLDQGALARGKPYWATLTVGEEWDSNVVLLGDGTNLPNDISSRNAFGTVWNANAGYEFLRTQNWSAGAMVNYNGEHYEAGGLDDFDYHFPVLSAWVDRRITERLSGHLQVDGGYAWVDGESWLRTGDIAPALTYRWGRDNYTRLFARFYNNDYMFGHDQTVSPQLHAARDRDGHGEQIGLEQGVPLRAINTQLTGSVFGGRYHSDGTEYDNRNVGTWAQTETALPWKLVLTLGAGFTYRPYVHATTFANPGVTDQTRRDKVLDTLVAIERPINDWLSVSARWSFTDNHSNVNVFDYDRHVVGAYLTFRLP